jgi:hypothetical protein
LVLVVSWTTLVLNFLDVAAALVFVPLCPSSAPGAPSRGVIGTSSLLRRHNNHHNLPQRCKTIHFNWLGDLWAEIIEFSTYGPSERRMLKARRQAEQEAVSETSFQEAAKQSQKFKQKPTSKYLNDEESLSLEAFQAVTSASSVKDSPDNKKEECPIDGYGLRDLIVAKWKVPIDIDFERIGGQVYITALPIVGYGTQFSRHLTELDYLMHLQAIVEILHRYENLDPWLAFVETTNASPKPGTQSVPFRLNISDSDLDRIFSGSKNV